MSDTYNPPSIPAIAASKQATGSKPLVMVTAYDAPSARIANEAGVDLILVGDSVAMTLLGYEDTLQVTVDDISYHTKAVCRTDPAAVVIADMPWLSFHLDRQSSIVNAASLIRSGAQGVKLEGGSSRVPMVEALLAAEIPVMGHIGLTPQSHNVMGGFKLQGKEADSVKALIADAKALEAAGCFAIVVEGVPAMVGELITKAIDIPTIGIGAGPATDGQVLVYQDIIGLENRLKPRFVRRYGTAYEDQVKALSSFANDVRDGSYPSDEESYQGSQGLAQELKSWY